jgi:DNA-binding PadR family transcriptional regulator
MSIIQTSMTRRATLGEFEHLVLLAVLRHADGVMGSHIGRELEARAKRRVSRGALYATLDRLRQKSFLTWEIDGRAVRSLSAGIEDLL